MANLSVPRFGDFAGSSISILTSFQAKSPNHDNISLSMIVNKKASKILYFLGSKKDNFLSSSHKNVYI